MKTAVEKALELTRSTKENGPRGKMDSVDHFSAREEGERRGRTVSEIQEERRLTAVASPVLQSALDERAEAENQLAKAEDKVARASGIQVEFEKLIERRTAIDRQIRRAEEQLCSSKAFLAATEAEFATWQQIETSSPLAFNAVLGAASEALAHEWIAKRLPAWIEAKRKELQKACEAVSRFKAEHRI